MHNGLTCVVAVLCLQLAHGPSATAPRAAVCLVRRCTLPTASASRLIGQAFALVHSKKGMRCPPHSPQNCWDMHAARAGLLPPPPPRVCCPAQKAGPSFLTGVPPKLAAGSAGGRFGQRGVKGRRERPRRTKTVGWSVRHRGPHEVAGGGARRAARWCCDRPAKQLQRYCFQPASTPKGGDVRPALFRNFFFSAAVLLASAYERWVCTSMYT